MAERLRLVRSDAGDGGWSLHDAAHPQAAGGPDYAGDDIVLSGPAHWDPEREEWDRPDGQDYAAAERRLPPTCDSCAEAGILRVATCRLNVAEDRPLCDECAEIIRQGIHDGEMGGNQELDGTWPEKLPL